MPNVGAIAREFRRQKFAVSQKSLFPFCLFYPFFAPFASELLYAIAAHRNALASQRRRMFAR